MERERGRERDRERKREREDSLSLRISDWGRDLDMRSRAVGVGACNKGL